MKELSNLAISSNEKREQRIMLLRAKYNAHAILELKA